METSWHDRTKKHFEVQIKWHLKQITAQATHIQITQQTDHEVNASAATSLGSLGPDLMQEIIRQTGQ